MSAQHIALYGKGGVGTSTTAANISVALAEAGYRVMQVGFDASHDSTGVLRGDRPIRTILDALRETGDAARDGIIVRGFKGVLCMETGLPSPELACTGSGSVAVIDSASFSALPFGRVTYWSAAEPVATSLLSPFQTRRLETGLPDG